MSIKLKKIADNLTDEEHSLIAEEIRQGNIDGISLSYLGGAFGPVWPEDKEYNLGFLKHYSDTRALEVFLPSLTSIDAIAEYVSGLEFLSLGEFSSPAVSLKPLQNLQKLSSLSLVRNKKDIGSITCLPGLRDLSLTGYQSKQVEHVAALRGLEKLYLGFGTFESLDAVKGLSRLKSLEICWVKKLRDLRSLQRLKSLECLSLSTLKQVASMPDLSELGQLKSLVMDTMNGLSSLAGIKGSSIAELAVINSKIDPLCFHDLSHGMPSLQRLIVFLASQRSTTEALKYFDKQLVCASINDFKFYKGRTSRVEYLS